MRYLLIILVTLGVQNLNGQSLYSIDFETKLTWAQISEKARKENKNIFIDIYTTWCAPCKQMARNVFTDKNVAEFFNSHFINVAVQMDSTEKDDKRTVEWRDQSRAFAKAYHINSYPTYIFLNSQGYFVHSIFGSSNANDFLAKAKMALNPKTQLINLKREFKMGSRDTSFLLTLIHTAIQSGDQDSIGMYINKFLAVTQNWNTRRNLEFIVRGTKTSDDVGFTFLLSHKNLVDSILGPHTALRILKNIAYDEVVFPLTRNNAEKHTYAGGMTVYSGEVIKDVDWLIIKTRLDSKFANIADEVLLTSKPKYYGANNQWELFCQSVDSYMKNTIDLDLYQLNNFAGIILNKTSDSQSIKSAINWSKLIISKADLNKTPEFLNSYSSLLYKSGETELAIKYLEKYLKLISFHDAGAEKKLREMKSAQGDSYQNL